VPPLNTGWNWLREITSADRALISEAVKKLFAGDRQLIMNMRSWHHE